jgi:serine/threonine protein kinase
MPEYGFSVTCRLNDEATRDRILRDAQELFESVAEKVVFYFSGHGCATPYGAYLVTVDGTSVEPGIDLPLLARMANAYLRPGRIVAILLDCCHSGAMCFRAREGASASSPVLAKRDFAGALTGLPEGNVLLSACRPDELAEEDPALMHGIFTYHLLQGLYGNAANEEGQITVSSLYDYVARTMEKRMVEQSVVFRGDISGLTVLGTGFSSIEKKEYNAAIGEEIDRKAYQLIEGYQAEVGKSFSVREVWAQSGYKAACQRLEPIFKWFKRNDEQYPELKQDKTFQSYNDEVISWRARLSNLDSVMQTPWGEVTGCLGYGTFGTVWQIARRGDRQQVEAFKVYHGQDIRLRDKAHRFRRGYEAMKMLDHPHIVKVAEYTDCPIGFFMDYIEGSNFREFTGTLEIDGQLRVLLTIAETLSHAHNRSVVHRDLKPENIIMKFDGTDWHPFLTDFDLAWFSTASLLTREAVGGTFYSAPEQIYKPNSSAARDPKVDVYGFGQLCFYALTTSDPVPNVSDNVAALKRHLKTWPAGDAANAIIQLYRHSTESDPEARIGDFRIICDELHRAIILCTADPSELITEDRFVRETIFGLAGFVENVMQPNAFRSLSNRLGGDIEITSVQDDSVSLTLHLESLAQLMMDSVDHEMARRKLNIRVDEIVSKVKGAKRRSGRSSIYEVFVDIKDVPLNFDGVLVVRRLLSRAMEAIERP